MLQIYHLTNTIQAGVNWKFKYSFLLFSFEVDLVHFKHNDALDVSCERHLVRGLRQHLSATYKAVLKHPSSGALTPIHTFILVTLNNSHMTAM